MKLDIAAGKCDKSGKPTGVNSLTATDTTQLHRKRAMHRAWRAPSRCSRWCQCTSKVPPAVRRLNIVPAQKTLMVASLHRAEYALLDSGSGLTSCPINYANDIPLLPRPANLPILSNSTGGSVECIGQRQVGYRLENGDPFVVTWHVANVTNLIISTESLTDSNIEVRHAKNESTMIMDRCGTQNKRVLHKFAKVPWLKLRRDNRVVDSDLLSTRNPWPSRRLDQMKQDKTRLRRKTETLGMDDTMEVPLTRVSEESDARGSRDPVAHPVETSIAQQTQHLTWCCGVMSLVDY